MKDILYRNDLASEDKAGRALCTLDLYLPEKTAGSSDGFPLLVWFHGGGLTSGERQGCEAVMRQFVERGIAVANADYRLNPAVKYPTYIEDTAQAVAWAVHWTTSAEAARANINPKAVFVGGHSAGGYLATMLAMDTKYLQTAGVPAGSIAGFLPMSGQLITHFTVRAERGLSEKTMAADDASPLYHVRKDVPPMLLLVGDDDMPARREEAQLFVTAMTKIAENTTTSVLVVADRTHNSVFDNLFTEGDPGGPAMLEFLRKYTPALKP